MFNEKNSYEEFEILYRIDKVSKLPKSLNQDDFNIEVYGMLIAYDMCFGTSLSEIEPDNINKDFVNNFLKDVWYHYKCILTRENGDCNGDRKRYEIRKQGNSSEYISDISLSIDLFEYISSTSLGVESLNTINFKTFKQCINNILDHFPNCDDLGILSNEYIKFRDVNNFLNYHSLPFAVIEIGEPGQFMLISI